MALLSLRVLETSVQPEWEGDGGERMCASQKKVLLRKKSSLWLILLMGACEVRSCEKGCEMSAILSARPAVLSAGFGGAWVTAGQSVSHLCCNALGLEPEKRTFINLG